MRRATAGTVARPDFDWGKLLDAKDREIARLNQIYIGMLEKAGVGPVRRPRRARSTRHTVAGRAAAGHAPTRS